MSENRVIDELSDAIETAINAGWTPRQFQQYCEILWDAVLSDKRRVDANEWRRISVK